MRAPPCTPLPLGRHRCVCLGVLAHVPTGERVARPYAPRCGRVARTGTSTGHGHGQLASEPEQLAGTSESGHGGRNGPHMCGCGSYGRAGGSCGCGRLGVIVTTLLQCCGMRLWLSCGGRTVSVGEQVATNETEITKWQTKHARLN